MVRVELCCCGRYCLLVVVVVDGVAVVVVLGVVFASENLFGRLLIVHPVYFTTSATRSSREA